MNVIEFRSVYEESSRVEINIVGCFRRAFSEAFWKRAHLCISTLLIDSHARFRNMFEASLRVDIGVSVVMCFRRVFLEYVFETISFLENKF